MADVNEVIKRVMSDMNRSRLTDTDDFMFGVYATDALALIEGFEAVRGERDEAAKALAWIFGRSVIKDDPEDDEYEAIRKMGNRAREWLGQYSPSHIEAQRKIDEEVARRNNAQLAEEETDNG